MRRHVPSAILAVVLLATSAGCGPAIDARTAAAEGRAMAKVHVAAPGPAALVGEAFAEVPLDPGQRDAVEHLAADTARRHAAIGDAMRRATGALADQVEAGRLDRTALRPHVAAIAAAWEASQPADRASIQHLHELLDIEQRQILADAVADQVEGRLMPPALHVTWATWKAVLDLDDEQASAIADAVRARVPIAWWHEAGWERHRRHEELQHFLDAFVDDGFVLDEELSPRDAHAVVAARAARVLDVVEAALPHLDARQRRVAADRIRRRGDDEIP